ncbi:hypothetical protein LJB87_02705 [Alistipes sp. OttesenSCG-928-L06]|nr:hypothetical protein [Alistipes sp. OttesenSCG-928-L06]
MRNLLMCKSPQTVSLLEVTGSVAQRFTEQAARASLPFLFESVNLLTGLDAGFRTATNQRLHVELGLMKLCGMGQKKNIADTSKGAEQGANQEGEQGVASEEEYPVPVLPVKDPSALKQAAVAPAPTPQPSVQPQAQPVQPPQPAVTPPQTPAASAPTAASAPAVTQTVPSPAPPKPKPAPAGASITGFSLKDALSAKASTPAEAQSEEEALAIDPTATPDEEVEKRLSEACTNIGNRFSQDGRPRLATAFSRVSVTLNRIGLIVPNENLKEEVERNMLDLKREIMEISGVKCAIEFDITVEADTSNDKPVKADDKLKFLTEQNAHLTAFRKALNLDIE